jgi:hypothetical protein
MLRIIVLATFALASLGIAHEGGKENCRVTLQSYFKDGKRKVDVTEVHVDSHNECKSEAQRRKLAFENGDGDEIYRVNVVFAYRDLAIVE